MKNTITVFLPGIEQPEQTEIDQPKAEPGLDWIKSVVAPHLGGRYLEHVTVLVDGERADLFVDEDGIAKGLQRNELATAVYRNNWLTQHPEVDPESISAVYGPAVLFKHRVWF